MAKAVWILALFVCQVSSECYIANRYSQARKRLSDPFQVAGQYDCFRACECANGVDRDCASLSPPVPLGNCLAYTFDSTNLKCTLFGEMQAGVCSNQGTIYIRGPCGAYPTCGETTLELGVICDSTGYVCPSGRLVNPISISISQGKIEQSHRYSSVEDIIVLPYVLNRIQVYEAMTMHSKMIYYGGTRVYFEDNLWNIFTDSLRSGISEDKMQSISCFPAIAPTFPACDIKPILFGNALFVNNTFQCLPGFAWSHFESDRHYTTVPVCSEEGWRERAGGPLLTLNSISTVRCD